MKKITMLVALMCSLSAFSMRYLVEGPGTKTWRVAGAGEENVILTIPLSDWSWNIGQNLIAGDEVWIAGGTYITTFFQVNADVSVYGSFAGTETAVSQRALVSGGKPWEFVNQTVFDGNGANSSGIETKAGLTTAYYDGLKITNYNRLGGDGWSTNGVAAQIGANCIMQNCIISNNTYDASLASNVGGFGAVSLNGGGQLLNSYIHHNSMLKGTGTKWGRGGAVAWNGNGKSTVKGCLIESNMASNQGGAICIWDNWGDGRSGGVVEDCIFKNNSAEAGGAIYSYSDGLKDPLTIKNNTFIGNTALFGGGAVALSYGNSNAEVTFSDNTFIGNSVTRETVSEWGDGGGAVRIDSKNFKTPIANCIFKDNKISGYGQGSALFLNKPATLQNCVFINNTSETNDVNCTFFVKMDASGTKVYTSTFANNVNAGDYTAIYFPWCTGTLTDCLFWGNNGKDISFVDNTRIPLVTYCGFDADQTAQAFYGEGCISTLTATNTFVQPTSFKGAPVTETEKAESEVASYKLKTGSPAIAAGVDLIDFGVEFDILGITRTVPYDLGAYQYVASNGVSTAKFDFGVYSINSCIILSGLPLNETISVYNVVGELIKTKKITETSETVSVPKGLYLVRVANKATKVYVQ